MPIKNKSKNSSKMSI